MALYVLIDSYDRFPRSERYTSKPFQKVTKAEGFSLAVAEAGIGEEGIRKLRARFSAAHRVIVGNEQPLVLLRIDAAEVTMKQQEIDQMTETIVDRDKVIRQLQEQVKSYEQSGNTLQDEIETS